MPGMKSKGFMTLFAGVGKIPYYSCVKLFNSEIALISSSEGDSR